MQTGWRCRVGRVVELREGFVSALAATVQARRGPTVEVSWGELVDKLTILEIKARHLTSPAALSNVRRELAAVNEAVHDLQPPAELAELKQRLTSVNENLWQIEDQIRAKEADGVFDRQFVDLARAVYINNDRRSDLKREINRLMNSDLVEEKQYTRYAAAAAD
jgi:predicted  nucleic acid-binding Zn-ribbon protein